MDNITLQQFVRNSSEYRGNDIYIDRIPFVFLRETLKTALKKAELFDLMCTDPGDHAIDNPKSKMTSLVSGHYYESGDFIPVNGKALAELLEAELETTREAVFAKCDRLNRRYKHDSITFTTVGAGDILIHTTATFQEPVVYLNVYLNGEFRYRKYWGWVPGEVPEDLVEFARSVAKDWEAKSWKEVSLLFDEHIRNPNKIRAHGVSGGFIRSDYQPTAINLGINDTYPFVENKEQE